MNADRLLTIYDRVADAPNAVPRLRRFVLDLAVRGKLVAQDPNDEPASELLKRIALEKTRLMKAKEIRKEKPIPPLLGDNPPFLLPAGWTWSQIAEIGTINPRNNMDEEEEASFVPMSLIPAQYGQPVQFEVRSWKEIKKGYSHFAENDVGLAKITPCFENGKSAIFSNLTGGFGSGTTELHVVRPIFVNPNYILLFFKSPHFIDTGVSRMTGTAGQKRVPREYFSYSAFPLPPLCEQYRIVAKVDELMAICDRLEAVRAEREEARNRFAAASLAQLRSPDPDPGAFKAQATFALDNLAPLATRPDQIPALRQTILDLAVRGKLVAQDPNDEPASESIERTVGNMSFLTGYGEVNIPGWFSAPIGKLIEANYGKGMKSSERLKRGPVPIFGSNGIVGYCETPLTERPSIIIGRKGSAGALNYCNGPSWTTDVAYFVTAPDYFDLRYLMTSLQTLDLPSLGKGVKPGLNRSELYNLSVSIPPLAEQKRIVTQVDELMEVCDRLEEALVVGDEARCRLLTRCC